MIRDDFSIVRLFVLGLLAGQRRHGYEIVAVADRWAIHRWTGISIGAIYHSIGKLAKEGLLAEHSQEREGNRPERQIWDITENGKKTLQSYIARGLSSLSFEGREIDMALAFAHWIPPADRVAHLTTRLAPLRERIQQLESLDHAYESGADPDFARLKVSNPWIHAGIQHGLGRLKWEEAWTLDLISQTPNWPSQDLAIQETKL